MIYFILSYRILSYIIVHYYYYHLSSKLLRFLSHLIILILRYVFVMILLRCVYFFSLFVAYFQMNENFIFWLFMTKTCLSLFVCLFLVRYFLFFMFLFFVVFVGMACNYTVHEKHYLGKILCLLI